MAWATLDPVAVAVRGPGVALAERAAALVISWLGILLAARSGHAGFGVVVVLMHLVPLAILVGAVDRRLLPSWSPELGRALGALGTTLGVYALGHVVHAPPALVAAVAVIAAAAWLGSEPRPHVALDAPR